jgi:hypothetical protein
VSYATTKAALLSAHSSLDDIERIGNMIATDDGMHRALATDYDEQLHRAEAELTSLGATLGATEEAALAARRLLASTERARIVDAHRAGAISDEQRDRRLAELRTRWWNDGTDA